MVIEATHTHWGGGVFVGLSFGFLTVFRVWLPIYGFLAYWLVGLFAFWPTGLLVGWLIDVLAYWLTCLLAYWLFGFLAY